MFDQDLSSRSMELRTATPIEISTINTSLADRVAGWASHVGGLLGEAGFPLGIQSYSLMMIRVSNHLLSTQLFSILRR